MRVRSFVAAVMAGVASVCGGAEKEFVGLRVSCDRDGQFRWAIKMPSEYCVFCPDAGRTGGAFSLRSVPKAKDTVFHGAPAYPKNVYATVRVTMWMKGSAKGRAGFMPYDRSFHCGSEAMKPFEVGPGDGWKEFAFEYRPPADGWYAVNVAHVAPFVIVGPDGDFLIDDVTVEFVDDPTRPSARPGTVKPKPREPTAAERAAAEKRQEELAALGERLKGEHGLVGKPLVPAMRLDRLPDAWRPARLCGRDWWYALPTYPKVFEQLEATGLADKPLFRDALYWMWWMGPKALTNDTSFYVKLARENPDRPIAFKGIDRVDIPPSDRKNPYFTCYFSPQFAREFERIYGGVRFLGVWDDEAFVCGSQVFAATLKAVGLPVPRNRDEAYDAFRACYEMTFDAVPARVPFRNLANASPYFHKYACNVAAGTFNPFLCALGDRIGGNETGDCMGPNAPKFAIARGSARQYGRPWRNYQTFYQWSFVDSRDSGGARCVTDDPELLKPGCRVKRACYLSGPDIGHDYARQKAVYLEPFLAGCTIWSGEDNHCELVQRWDDETVGSDDPAVVPLRDVKLQPSAMVRKHLHFYDEIVLKRDRGVTVTPFAVIFDRASGYVPMYFYGNVWDFFAPTELERTMWAFAAHVYRPYGLNTYYTSSPYGDVFDIVTNDASEDFLSSYPILMPIGDTRLDAAFAKRLVGCVEKGATLVINAELLKKYPKAFDAAFLGVCLADAVAEADTSYSRLSGRAVAEKKPFAYRKAEILPGTDILALTADKAAAPLVTSHAVGRGCVIVTLPLNMKPKGAMTEMLALFDDLLGQLRREALPIRVSAPANVQHMINRSATSWIVYLNNVNGIAPATGAYAKPPVTDVSKSVRVKVGVPGSLGKVAKAIDWWTGKDLPLRRGRKGAAVEVELAGGDCAAIEFVLE